MDQRERESRVPWTKERQRELELSFVDQRERESRVLWTRERERE